MYNYKAKVTRLFRYNSIELSVDLGFGNSMVKKFKISNLPEPEIDYPAETEIDDINKRKTIISEITQKLNRFVSNYLLNKEVDISVEKVSENLYSINDIHIHDKPELNFREDFNKIYKAILEEYLSYE